MKILLIGEASFLHNTLKKGLLVPGHRVLTMSDGKPVVYVQHYGFDAWALEWWTEEQRTQLFDILEHYNLAAFFVGHTPAKSVQHYRGDDIHQVNNAWRDDDGNASFDVLQIKGKRVTVETYEVLDGNGNFKRL